MTICLALKRKTEKDSGVFHEPNIHPGDALSLLAGREL